MKKSVCVLAFVVLILCYIQPSIADSYNPSTISTRSTFIPDNDINGSWSYLQVAQTQLKDGTLVQIMLGARGNRTEALIYPQLGIFITTADNTSPVTKKASLVIDGNMFNLTLNRLDLDDSTGAVFTMTSDSFSFIQALAMAQFVSVDLTTDYGNMRFTFPPNDFSPVSEFFCDLLRIDYMNHISADTAELETRYQQDTPINSLLLHSVNVVLPDDETIQLPTSDNNEWIQYSPANSGVTVSLPANYTAYTRGMHANDPAVLITGYTPAQIDSMLVASNYYLEATDNMFDSEIFVSITPNPISSYATISDDMLLEVAAGWQSSDSVYGMQVLDTELVSINGMRYLLVHATQKLANNKIVYKIIYNTIIDYRAYNFAFSSSYDDVTQDERMFMRTFMDHIIFEDKDTSGTVSPELPIEPSPRTFTLPDGPFTVTIDEARFNVLIPGMSADEPAVIRSGLTDEMYEPYMRTNDKALLMFDINDSIPAPFTITIKIKDRKYDGIDLRQMSSTNVVAILDVIYDSFVVSGAKNKQIVTINGTPYLKFSWMNGKQLRYATVVNGDMIYIWATRDGGCTADDDNLLQQIVESISFPIY